MLRHSKQLSTSLSTRARALTVGVLVLLGLIVAGLRGPVPQPAALAADDRAADSANTVKNTGLDLSLVSSEAVGLVSIRPAEILRRPEFKELAAFLNESIAGGDEIGLPLQQIERITWVSLRFPPGSRAVARSVTPQQKLISWILPFDGGYLIMRTSDAEGSKRFAGLMGKDLQQKRFGGRDYYMSAEVAARGQLGYCRLDDRTVAIAAEPVLKLFLLGRGGQPPRFARQPIWRQIEKDPLILAVDVQRCLEQVPAAVQREIPTPIAAFAPLWQDAATVALGVGVDGQVRIRGAATCRDEEGAKRWQETSQAAKVLGRNATKQARAELRASPDVTGMNLAVSAMDALDQLLDGLRLQQQGRIVRLQAAAKLDAARVWLMADALNSARASARRAQSINNLKMIALAMHNYHDLHKRFPAAASYDVSGKPLLSWRVHILALVEGEELYRKFHLDEPWDSPHNIKLLPRMPSIYRHPADQEPGKYHSSYFVLTGPDTAFAGQAGVRIRDITDGTTNTIMAVEARRPVPWTKPEDIPYDPDKPVPKLGGFTKGVFNAALGDGSVRAMNTAIDERTLRALIGKADGQRVDYNALK